ncbi:nuclear transport factor 2 family protein [Streptomyces beijiangensis]|uniref:Nuclear transport factor 2 family protein n=1 Tax=Streptomyces beijiangensis TaxID=163361 RepID=A0A939FGN3_9ACTN|nr:nuclear transport factor 2 family protein [Streptomyces beijiangensis]MBO0516765.1 nuclear transport factor 2 family protein [Streptomyces beijiangensis]
MTQRVELATVMDRLDIDELITGYAVAVDDGDWAAYRGLFTPAGRADYRTSGGIEGPASEVADWLAEMMQLFPVRQHLICNRLLRIQDLGGYPGDRAELQADYVNPMRLRSPDDDDDRSTEPNFESGGRYAFSLLRTDGGWRVHKVVVHEKWRRTTGALAAAG